MLINIIICICAQSAKELAVNFECPIIFCSLLPLAECVGVVEYIVKFFFLVYNMVAELFPALGSFLFVFLSCHNSNIDGCSLTRSKQSE